MLNIAKFGAKATLVNSLNPLEQQITIPSSLATSFALPTAGTYMYATLKYNNTREVVRINSTVNNVLNVTRAIDNTTAQYFPSGTCIEVDWSPIQLCEYVKQCTGAATPTGVTAGVYCLSCTTCLTINAEGRITAVDGEVKC